MVFKCVVFVALVAVARAGLISSQIGLASPQIALGGLGIARSGLINNIGLASPLLRSQLIAQPQLIAQQPLLAQQQIIAQPQLLRSQIIAQPQLLRSQVIAQPQIIAQQPLIQQQVIAQPQLLRSQVIAQPQLVRSQVIAQPQLLAAPVARTVVAQAEYDPNPQYSYAYDVQDALTGDNKNQQETRSGDVVQGSYSLNDPDGTRRTVEYTADPVNGFNAVVHRTPLVQKVAVAAPAIARVASPLALSSQILG